MKKKIILTLLLSLIIFPLYSNSIVSTKTLGMGKTGIADVDSFYNPANLSLRDENSPTVVSNLSLIQDFDVGLLSSSFGVFQSPNLSMGIVVYGPNLGLTLNLDNSLENRTYDGSTLSYTGYNRFTLQLDWGYELLDFDFGLRIRGGNISKKSNFELRLNPFFVTDYLVNIFLSSYTNQNNSDFFSFGLALRYDINENYSVAYLSETDVDINSSVYDILSIIKASSLGFTYSSNKYSDLNKLNTFVYKFSFDLSKIGDNNNRESRIGGEVKLQLGNTNSIAFRAGIYEDKPAIADLFGITFSRATTTYALAYENEGLFVVANMDIPFSTYSDYNNGLSVTLNALIEL